MVVQSHPGASIRRRAKAWRVSAAADRYKISSKMQDIPPFVAFAINTPQISYL
jgi:hypothetical protein